MIHFDSSFVIATMIRDSDEARQLHQWFDEGQQFGISTVAWAEFMCGPLHPEEEVFGRVLTPQPSPLSMLDAELGAKLFNATGRRRGSFNDCLIAAACISAGAALATSNPADFQRFVPHGLKLAFPVRR